MKHDELIRGIEKCRPGAQWVLHGDSYEGLEWLSDKFPKPSLEEIQVASNAVSYIELRRKSYPAIGDQLDALWKGGEAAAEMLAQVQAVKAKYPKP